MIVLNQNKFKPIKRLRFLKMTPDEAFFVACYKNDLLGAKRELENGADINYVCKANGWTALHGAAHAGHLEIVQFLVEKGLDHQQNNALEQTPLHLAASGGHVDIIQWFTSICGADITMKTASGNSTVDIARLAGHVEVLEMFGEKL